MFLFNNLGPCRRALFTLWSLPVLFFFLCLRDLLGSEAGSEKAFGRRCACISGALAILSFGSVTEQGGLNIIQVNYLPRKRRQYYDQYHHFETS